MASPYRKRVETMPHILLVDDDDAVRRALTRYLQLHGHVVTAVPDGRVALEHVGPHTDIVVTDLNMPGMSGVKLTAALRGRGVRVPVILMSGGDLDPEEVDRIDYLLRKPFGPRDLTDLIDVALRRSSRRDMG